MYRGVGSIEVMEQGGLGGGSPHGMAVGRQQAESRRREDDDERGQVSIRFRRVKCRPSNTCTRTPPRHDFSPSQGVSGDVQNKGGVKDFLACGTAEFAAGYWLRSVVQLRECESCAREGGVHGPNSLRPSRNSLQKYMP